MRGHADICRDATHRHSGHVLGPRHGVANISVYRDGVQPAINLGKPVFISTDVVLETIRMRDKHVFLSAQAQQAAPGFLGLANRFSRL